jgi:hypothetical protein
VHVSGLFRATMTFCQQIVVFGLLGGLLPFSAFSQKLEVQPGSITVPSGNFTVDTRIVLTNSSGETLRRISIDQYSNDGIKADPKILSAQTAAAKNEIVWPVKILVPGSAHLPGSVVFEATYLAGTKVGHVFASLALLSEGDKKPVEASLQGNLEPISQQRPGSLYLVVTNNLDVPVAISVASQVSSPAVQVSPVTPFPVRPRSSAAQKIEIDSPSRVTPGAHDLVIDVTATWDGVGQIREERHFALTKSVTVGVFFESELLKALSIPSFLVLPGCLTIFTMQLMLSFGVLGLKNESKLPELTIVSPGFWILAVTFSGLFAPVYYWLTRVNYLLSYGVDDLRNVWLASIAIGAVVYLAIAGLTLKRRRERVPDSSDEPVTVLKKLAKNHLGILLPEMKYKINTLELKGLAIEKIEDGQTLVWICPRITAEWEDTPKAQALKVEFDDIINGTRDPLALAGVLERAGDLVKTGYESIGAVPNPYHLKVEAITAYLPARLIVG